jgi:hypothetical protein
MSPLSFGFLFLAFLAACSAGGGDTSAPSVPTGVATASATTKGQVDLSWAAATDNVGVTGYKIYRNGTYLKTVGATSYSDADVDPSTQYCYAVSALDAAGNESPQSDPSCAKTPNAFLFVAGFLPGTHFNNGLWNAAADDDFLKTGKSVGMTVVQMMIPDFEDPLGKYSETELKKLDHVIYRASVDGVYLIPSFIHGLLLYRPPYSSDGLVEGLIKNTRLKAAFKNRIKTLLTRRNTYSGKTYKEDPAILGWIIIDEPISNPANYEVRAPNVTAYELRDWLDEMGSYIKSIDPNHLVTLFAPGGIGGVDGPGTWVDVFSASALDFFMTEDAGMYIIGYPCQYQQNCSADFPLKLLKLKKPLVTMIGFGEILDRWEPSICGNYSKQAQLLSQAIPAYFTAKAQGVCIFPWISELSIDRNGYRCFLYTIRNIPICDAIKNAAANITPHTAVSAPLRFVKIGQFKGGGFFIIP